MDISHQTNLDTTLDDNSWLAKAVSNVINPVLVGIFILAVLTFRTIKDPTQAITWFSITVLLTSVPPLIYVSYLVKIGYLSDIHMPNRERRLKPISVIFAWLILSLVILVVIHAPLTMVLVILGVLMQVVLLGLVTLYWKISFHSATIMSAAMVTILMRSETALIVPLLVPLVSWARVRLRRHTLMQVIIGCLAGGLIATSAFYFLEPYLMITLNTP